MGLCWALLATEGCADVGSRLKKAPKTVGGPALTSARLEAPIRRPHFFGLFVFRLAPDTVPPPPSSALSRNCHFGKKCSCILGALLIFKVSGTRPQVFSLFIDIVTISGAAGS